MTICRSDAGRLQKLVLLLSSDQPGEVAAAAAAIGRLLASQGLSWHDLATQLDPSPPPSPAAASPASPSIVEMLATIAEIVDSGDVWLLTEWENEFFDSVREQYRRRGRLSPKQQATVTRIWQKVAR